MTIHKSKGLEFHTVVFMGLEDSAFWSFKTQAKEDTCAFFVAFSRAKKKIIFTFSQKRVTNPEWNSQTQNRTMIGALYQLLEQAGIKPERIPVS
jgi:superfamily I DNA/RNA helicase